MQVGSLPDVSVELDDAWSADLLDENNIPLFMDRPENVP